VRKELVGEPLNPEPAVAMLDDAQRRIADKERRDGNEEKNQHYDSNDVCADGSRKQSRED
jgi:hypothetical protein